MKKLIYFLVILFIYGSAISQDYVYDIKLDEPDKGMADLYINWNIATAQADFSGSNGPNLNVYTGLWALYSPGSKVWGAEVDFRKGVFNNKNQDLNGNRFQLGGFYNFSSKRKKKNVGIQVGTTMRGTTTVKEYIKVPATIRRNHGIRAGILIDKGFTYGTIIEKTPWTGVVKGYFSYGTTSYYLGLQVMTLANHYVLYRQNGNKKASDARHRTWLTYYLDFIYTPGLSMDNGIQPDGTANSNYGVRFGETFLNPLTRNTDYKRNIAGAFATNFEIGYKRVQGFYISLGIVYQIIRTKLGPGNDYDVKDEEFEEEDESEE